MPENFEDYKGSGWGHKIRRDVFHAACKYLGQNPMKIENIYGAAMFSVLHGSRAELTGVGLEKVKRDPEIIQLQNSIIDTIKKNPNYKKRYIPIKDEKSVQLGGKRAQAEMWKQALGIWRWADEYSATWRVAFDELTWLLRSIRITYNGEANKNGVITINYHFLDTFDLRPDWGSRTTEYNAICAVLGYIYHDAIGCNDQLKIEGNWTVEIRD